MRKVFETFEQYKMGIQTFKCIFLKHVVSPSLNQHDIAYQNVYNQKYMM